MPRYHFHTEAGTRHSDQDGLELPDAGAAQHEAIRALAQLVEEWSGAVWETGGVRMTVTDADGLTLFSLDLSASAAPPAQP